VVVGGMLVGPVMLLLVVPALQTMFLRRQGGSAAASGSERADTADAHT